MRRSAQTVTDRALRRGIGATFFLAAALAAVVGNSAGWGEPHGARIEPKGRTGEEVDADAPESWQAGQLVGPEQLSRTLADPKSSKPLILCVGPNILYRSGHILGAVRLGPASQPEGLESLQKQVQSLSRTQEIVLYCGCCPWQHCPNVRPAFNLLRKLGFTNAKVLHLPNSLKQDWTDKGYPIQRGESVSASN